MSSTESMERRPPVRDLHPSSDGVDGSPATPSSPRRRTATSTASSSSPLNSSTAGTSAQLPPSENREQAVTTSPSSSSPPPPPLHTLALPITTTTTSSEQYAPITRRRQRRLSQETSGSSSTAASSADALANRRFRLPSQDQGAELRQADRQRKASGDRRPSAMLVPQDVERRRPSSSTSRESATSPSSSRSSSVASTHRLNTKRRTNEGQGRNSSTARGGATNTLTETATSPHRQPSAHSNSSPHLAPPTTTRSSSMSSLPPLHMPRAFSGTANAGSYVGGSDWEPPYRTGVGGSEYRRAGQSRMVSSRSEHTGLQALGLDVTESRPGLASFIRHEIPQSTASIPSPGNLVPIPPARYRTPSPPRIPNKTNTPPDNSRESVPPLKPSPQGRRQHRQMSVAPPAPPRPPPIMRSISSFSQASGEDANRPSPPIPAKNPLRSRMNSRSTSTIRIGSYDLTADEIAGSRQSMSSQHSPFDDVLGSASYSAGSSTGESLKLPAPATLRMENFVFEPDTRRNQGSAKSKESISYAPDQIFPSPPTGQSPAQPSSPIHNDSFDRPMWNVPSPSRMSTSADGPVASHPRSPSCPSSLAFEGVRITSTARVGVPRLHVFTSNKLKETEGNLLSVTTQPRRSIPHLRTQSIPAGPLVSPNFSTSSIDSTTLRSPTKRLTKRAHLIHEIIETERSFARDLALVRDAYLYRLRPDSARSSVSHGGISDGPSPMPFGGPGSRVSVYTYDTAETRRSSVSESPGAVIGHTPLSESDLVASPKQLGTRSSEYFGDLHSMPPPSAFQSRGTNSISTGSYQNSITPQPSPRTSSLPTATATPSKSDLKTVFLNLEQLTAFSEELSSSFSTARGDGTGQEVVEDAAQKEATSRHHPDRLGKAFLSAMPSISSLYSVYCARHSQANTRLQELMSDNKLTKYFSECWTSVQPFTNAWDLASVLIKPVQRVMKYPMLFADLLACTSPVHPDYFDLRKAAEGSRQIADEINEAKRRKDVVERVVFPGLKKRDSGVTIQGMDKSKSSASGVALKLGKRFRKDKSKIDGSSSVTASFRISIKSEEDLRDSIRQLEAGDRVVRRVGKEVNGWPERVRIVWVSQKSMLDVWAKVVQLESSDPMDERINSFKALIDEVLRGPITVLDAEVCKSIMPLFSRLLRMAVNPRAVISRLDAKRNDYIRVSSATSKSEFKSLDRAAMQNAEEFMAIHTQLLEELPRFIDGYTKILDLGVAAFANAQTRFHSETKTRLREFMEHWDGEDIAASRNELLDGRSVVKRWHDLCKPSMDALDSLEIVHPPTRSASSRDLSVSDLAASVSRNTSTRVHLSRNSSLNRLRELTTSRPSSPFDQLGPSDSSTSFVRRGNRNRSSSFMNQVIAASNVGVGSSRTSVAIDGSKEEIIVTPAGDFGPSLMSKESANSLTAAAAARRRDSDGTSLSSYSAFSPAGTPILGSEMRAKSVKLGSPFPGGLSSPNLGSNDQAIRSWRKELALYQCVCVASFALDLELWYAGLPFLNPLEEGEVVDILHEVGRVDMLEDLPIDVGVPDDGLLVGRNQDGRVGVLLCSYAMPLV